MDEVKVPLAIALIALPFLTAGSRAQSLAGEIEGPPLVSSSAAPLYLPRTAPHQYGHANPVTHRATPDVEGAMVRSAAAKIIPLWQETVKVGPAGKTTTKIVMVGKNPFVKQSVPSTSVQVLLIPVQFKFMPQNVVFDPTVLDPACSPHHTPFNLAKVSPPLSNRSYVIQGTNLGSGQYGDIFQRANFWSLVKPGALNPGYHITLNPVTVMPLVKVIVRRGTVENTQCGKAGLLKGSDWTSYVQTLIPQLKSKLTPNTFPIFLVYNVFMYDNSVNDNFFFAGFHDWIRNPAFGGAEQTYATTAYITDGFFAQPLLDSSILSHEIAEWIDDPLLNNAVPSWGNIGQVSGCQNNLEVGDPLTPNLEKVSYSGLTFHVQDLAFASWFLRWGSRVTPSTALKNFSLYGTLKKASAPCS